MQEVVPAVEQVVTGVLLQFTLFPLVVLVVPFAKDVGVVPRREMINPWQ
jgi:predicted Na+-dependent transporter